MSVLSPRTSSPAKLPRPSRPASSRNSRRPRLSIIDRYLLRAVMVSTGRGMLWFGGLLMTVAVIVAVRKVASQGLPTGTLFNLVLYQMPRVFLFALPMSVLYGTLEAFAEMSGNGEMTALLAGGLSLKRLLRMPLLWGALLALTAFLVQDVLVPRAQDAQDKEAERGIMAAMGTGRLLYQDPPPGKGPLRRIVQAASFDPRTNTLTRPVVQIFNSDQQIALQISAERGLWNKDTNKWRFIRGQITLFPGHKQPITKRGSDFSISGDFDQLERDDAPSPDVLGGAAKTLRQHLEHGDFEVISFAPLWNYRTQMLEQGADADQSPAQYKTLLRAVTYGLHDKIATALVCITLVLVGIALGLRPQRTGSGFAVGSSLGVLLIYYSLWTWTSASGVAGQGNPILLAYAGPFVTLVLGGVLLWRKRL